MNIPKILVVDDLADIREFYARFLQRKKFTVFTAPSGEEGREIFQKERPHIVISDLRMDGMGGVEMLKKIREMDKECFCIALTGTSEEYIKLEELEAIGIVCMFKPKTQEEIFEKIRPVVTKITQI